MTDNPHLESEGVESAETPAPWEPPWAHLSDEELLPWRVCELKVRIEGSAIEAAVHRLGEELDDRGIRFHPQTYLTTEWLCPDRIPLIGIPFCLTHDRLRRLEQTMMLEVEGGTEAQCMQLLRHEAGHAINYAYKLYRRNRWRELFGPITAEYSPHSYPHRPYSRQFVVHLEGYYAQAHPDEDFAETFAVWLTPGFDWRKRYRGWGALRKLEYMDHLMRDIGPRPPLLARGPRLWPVNRVRSTLSGYYRRKREEFAEAYPGYYDADLHELFTTEPGPDAIKASLFLSRSRRHMTNTVSRWAHVHKYAVDQLVRRLGRRCRELRLYLRQPPPETLMTLSVYLTALVGAQGVSAASEENHSA